MKENKNGILILIIILLIISILCFGVGYLNRNNKPINNNLENNNDKVEELENNVDNFNNDEIDTNEEDDDFFDLNAEYENYSFYKTTDKKVIKLLNFKDKTSLKETGGEDHKMIVSLSDNGIKYTNWDKTIIIPFAVKAENIKSIRTDEGGNGFCFHVLFVLTKDNKVYKISTTEEFADDFTYQEDLSKLKQEIICEDAVEIDYYYYLFYKNKNGDIYSYSDGKVDKQEIDLLHDLYCAGCEGTD